MGGGFVSMPIDAEPVFAGGKRERERRKKRSKVRSEFRQWNVKGRMEY